MRFSLLALSALLTANAVTMADARLKPADMSPLVSANYVPVDKDEKGLWSSLQRAEEEIAVSPMRVTDPALNAYVAGVLKKVAPPGVNPRLYIVRTATPNAGMYPNGMMLVQSGILTRMQNEAQLAAMLAHETAHYLRLHSLRKWRDVRARTSVTSFLTVGLGIGGVATGVYTGDLIRSLNNAMVVGYFAYSRDMEAEADAMSITLLRNAGYAPQQASRFWSQMIGERDASAKARGRRPDRGFSVFATHPADELRMSDLSTSALEVPAGGDEFAAPFASAIAPVRSWLLDDQVKLNDPGTSLYLLDQHARQGWDGLLKYEQAEVYRLRDAPGDRALMATRLAEATRLPGAPPVAWRAQGYALIKAGDTAGGKAALAKYLELVPDARDAAMVRFTVEK